MVDFLHYNHNSKKIGGLYLILCPKQVVAVTGFAVIFNRHILLEVSLLIII